MATMTFKKRLKSVILIINYKTIIVTSLAVLSTWVCGMYNIRADLPLTLIGIAIVFPVVFSIDSAYKRRERVLMLLGDMKAHLISLYFAARDWIPGENSSLKEEVKSEIINVYTSLSNFCTGSVSEFDKNEELLLQSISNLSRVLQKLRDKNMYLGEVSRINQYVSKVTIDIENIMAIRRYPTPVTLRAYSKVFIFSFPILYGPYFEFIGDAISHNLEYMMPIVFSFILVSLDNIQEHLENPFDQVGEDDIHFKIPEFANSLD